MTCSNSDPTAQAGTEEDPLSHTDIDITCDGELIPKVSVVFRGVLLYALSQDHTLKFVYITRWRTKDPPLK